MSRMLVLYAYVCIPTIIPCQLQAGDLKLVYRHGHAVQDREKAIGGRILFASWVNDANVIFATDRSTITRIAIPSGERTWSVKLMGGIDNWSFSRHSKRLAIRTGKVITILDASNGTPLFRANNTRLADLLKVESINPSHISLSPNGSLLICESSPSFGANAYLVDKSYKRVASRHCIDAHIREVSLRNCGRYMTVVGDGNLLSIRDTLRERDVFLLGRRRRVSAIHNSKKRQITLPEYRTVLDAPYYSHMKYGGGRIAVYSKDGGLVNGHIYVRDLCANRVRKIDAGNAHIEMDVDFRARRIVVTGTAKDVTIIDFEGKKRAHATSISQQRNLCVEFSPSGRQVLVGSWDNTLSVFTFSDR